MKEGAAEVEMDVWARQERTRTARVGAGETLDTGTRRSGPSGKQTEVECGNNNARVGVL